MYSTCVAHSHSNFWPSGGSSLDIRIGIILSILLFLISFFELCRFLYKRIFIPKINGKWKTQIGTIKILQNSSIMYVQSFDRCVFNSCVLDNSEIPFFFSVFFWKF